MARVAASPIALVPPVRTRKRTLYSAWTPYLFLVPFFVIFIPFGAATVLGAVAIGFVYWEIGGDIEFVGLQNFTFVLRDSVFQIALWNTLRMFLGYIVILVPLAMVIAVALNRPNLACRRTFQVVYFLPITMSLIVVAMVFDLLYDERAGVLNAFLTWIGGPRIRWLEDPSVAPWSIIALRVWRVVGYYAVILYAGLQSIPSELYEAAAIDGANGLQRFRHITLPLLRPVTLFVIVAASIAAWELFAEPYVLTEGGPARSTLTAVMYIYRQAFLSFDLGRGAAAAAILAVAIIAVTILQVRFLRGDHDA
ncbi:MAG: sugar transporter [Dehalococcoidia bacterium]|nr:MAG: sugar transporter [Dehalococcoidia bacterium]